MLAHILALTVGLLSFALYMSAFFFPEVYRKSDLTWSGIGLFYALVLWVCAGRITGGVLLGQTASVALLGWLGWQTINLRRELAPIALRTPLPNEAKTIGQAAQFKLGELKSRWQQTKLADQTNRIAGAIASWTSSIATPKKQPPSVGSRSRKSKKSVSPAAIEPAAIREPVGRDGLSEPIVAEPVTHAEIVADAEINEPAIDPSAVEPSAAPVRPARASGLFGGLRRSASKAKSKAPQRPTPPQPSPDLEEFENWDDEETIDPASTSDAAIEDAVVIVESDNPAIEEVVVIVEPEETAIENGAVETDDPAIEEVVVVSEPDKPTRLEVIEVEVIEAAAPPADRTSAAASASNAASLEAVTADDGAIDSPSANGDEPATPQS